MRKVFLFVSFVFCFVYTIDAQNIEPGNDAQGYLNSKNMLVDYCTGIFHYTVPLFEVSSGDFKLPLSINYSSREPMQREPGGIVGAVWHLQTGGVVTRVIRGGIADEQEGKGFIYQARQDNLSEKFIADANNHLKDGESDIFTASFGNNSVNFIIKKLGNLISAIPLERTNVKIECEYDSSTSSIAGWIVTDENGVRYIFRVKEWTRNVDRRMDVITNNLTDKSYISSWYLSSIEVPNSSPIYYYYESEEILESGDETKNKLVDFECVNYSTIKYYYGRKMCGFKFDFDNSKKNAFKKRLQAAESRISFEQFLQSHKNLLPLSSFDNAFSQANISISDLSKTMNSIGAVLGVVSTYREGNFPTARVIQTLYELARFYKTSAVVVENLNGAANILINAIRTIAAIDSSRVTGTYSYRISTPVLKKISTATEDICFNYNTLLSEVILKDYRGVQKQKIVLDIKSGCLHGVFWHGNDDAVFQWQHFNYSGVLLSGIYLATGAEVGVEYESNVCNTELVKGKRVKTIIIEDGMDGRDTIEYRYPYPGFLVYDQISYNDTIRYGGIPSPDRVVKTLPICKGVVYLNQGNNGVVYHYVEEKLRGKGSSAYLFSVPAPSGNWKERSYSFWLYGLPLGKAVYNAAGQLISLQKNRYYTDLTCSRFGFGKEWFEQGASDFNYALNEWQVELCEYFMGGDELKKYYQKQPQILLYRDFKNVAVYLDPYYYYTLNIECRRYISSPRQGYKMYYGGKTVLKSRKEYAFPGSTSTTPAITHLTGGLPAGAVLMSDVEYKYDNPVSNAKPTRVVHTRANGDQLVVMKRTPLEITQTDSRIQKMRDLNIVSPVIKEQVLLLKNGASQYLLLGESVNHYREYNTTGKIVLLPEKTSRFAGNNPLQVATAVPALENYSLTGKSGEYREELYNYHAGNDGMLLEEYLVPSGVKALCHDSGNNQVVMEAESCERIYIDAIDKYRVLFNSTGKIRDNKIAGNTLLNDLKVTTDAYTRGFVVTLLVKPASSKLSLSYSVEDNAEKNYTTSERVVVSGKWQIVQFDIIVTSGTSLRVHLPAGGLALGAIAPKGIRYEACSRDAAGKIFGKFDQNGLLERYEYDGAGRLLKVYDKDGYLLKEFSYKINI